MKALQDLGLKWALSADPKGEAPRSSTLAFLPSTTTLTRLRTRSTPRAVPPIPSRSSSVLFHAYDFQGLGARGQLTHAQFVDLLDWTAAQPDVRIKSLGPLMTGTERLGVRRVCDASSTRS